jgi:hypothetical protein
MLDLKKCKKDCTSEDRHEQQASQNFCQEGLVSCALWFWISDKLKVGHAAKTNLHGPEFQRTHGTFG